MAQPATTPKIEELRFRLKTDAKSRIFYPLAEELRKVGQFTEAEQVLRSGLGNHPSYLSAWVSLGRVQRELKDHHGAVESLSKALQLDPGNVVAARLLADAYLALGEKLEALKKYKLVHALLPGEEDLEAVIDQLDNELNPITLARAEETAPAPAAAPAPPPAPIEENPFSAAAPDDAAPWAEPEAAAAPPPVAAVPETPDVTGDSEPMHLAHTESPFEEPVAETYGSAAVEVEAPGGFHIDASPLSAEVPAPPVFPSEESDVFAPADAVTPEPVEDITNTLTMADLYARQGLTSDARHIFETILQRDPGNTAVREKLDALNTFNAPAAAPEPELSPFAPEPEVPSLFADTEPEPEPEPEPIAEPEPVAVPPAVVMQHTPTRAKVARLESWLKKVGGAEVKGV